MAIAALTLGLLGVVGLCGYGIGGFLGIGGIVCGHLAMSTIKKTGDTRSRGLARGGLITGYIATVIALISTIAIIAFVLWAVNEPSISSDYSAAGLSMLSHVAASA